MPYVPHGPADIAAMLEAVGRDSIEDLFSHLPADVRLQRALDLPDGLSEQEVRDEFRRLAARNHGQTELVSFLGGGVYDSVIPAAVDALSSRSEFLTAYTPYQPEVSQGTLQAIYEWQSFICRLTGLPVANASMYDGATALAEALLVACTAKRRNRVVLPETLNPRHLRVVRTMLAHRGLELVVAPVGPDGVTDTGALAGLLDETVGAVTIANPNYLGLVEPVLKLGEAGAACGAAVVAAVNPVSLSVLRAPAEYGADLAVGEAQPFGIPCSWGGPLLGFLACSEAYKRRIPGRVVGRTVDTRGQEGYVLTLQTREQHIRREKATSNICSNQGLNALRATIYLSLLGPQGFLDLGEANRARIAAVRREVEASDGAHLPFAGPVFNETVVRLERGTAAGFRAHARARGVLAGIPLDGVAGCGPRDLLVAVTEKRTAAEIARWGELLRSYLADPAQEAS